MFITPIMPMEFGDNNTITQSEVSSVSQIPFANLLSQAIEETNKLSEIAEIDSQNLLLGNVDNLAQVQINSMKAESMIQTTVQLTTRVVNAYKEIMQMQI